MNSYLFTAITLCLAAQCALAQYQPAAQAYGSSQQRKAAPSPQTYQSAVSAAAAAAPQYEQQQYEQQQYEEPSSYRSASASSQYEAPAATSGYGRQTGNGYGAPAKQASAYQAAASYAKPAPAKYEEPYHPPMPFAWGYDINDGYGGAQYHKENGDEYGKRTGSYGYTDAYGVYRQVDYVADEHGFRATIKTNEPGTANESPADVELHAYEPPSNYYAGNSYSAAPKSAYGASSASAPAYSAPAAASSYAPAAASHGGSSAGPSSYASPASSYAGSAAQSYGGNKQAQSYGSKPSAYAAIAAPRPSAGYGQQQQRQQQYEQQYSSSMMVPVYQGQAAIKAAPRSAASNKRAY